MAYITDKQISQMSYRQLGKAVVSGELTERRLKDYYTSARKTAMSRTARVSKTTEFGTIEKENFMKLKNITTTSALLHEIADVNRFLGSKRSTITGLKQQRSEYISSARGHGFDFLNTSNYGEWINFMQWFRNSEFAKYYDSNDDEVSEVFEGAESASPEEWSKLFNEFLTGGSDNGDNKVRQY